MYERTRWIFSGLGAALGRPPGAAVPGVGADGLFPGGTGAGTFHSFALWGCAAGNSAAAVATMAVRHTPTQTMCSVCGSGQGGEVLLREMPPWTTHHPATSPEPRGRARSAEARTPGGGGGAQQLQLPEAARGRAFKRGRVGPPPGQTGTYAPVGRGTAQACRDRGDINPYTLEVLAQARSPAATQAGARHER